MKLLKIPAILLLLAASAASVAVEIENVNLPDSVKSEKTGKVLVLNGAGIRKKFFFDIYVAGLYLENKSDKPLDIIRDTGEKQIFMHFLYDEVAKEKLVAGWTEGFEENHTEKQMSALKTRLEKFNSMFDTVRKGNTIRLDFGPGGELIVVINGQLKGKVEGMDFQRALLSIWLGENPVTDELKNALLGKKTD